MVVPPVLFPFGYPHTLYHSAVFVLFRQLVYYVLVKVNVYTSVICFQVYLKSLFR